MSARWRAARPLAMLSAERRKFSTSTILSVIATAHSSPIVKRLHALVGLHEFAEHLRIEAAVGVRDERPGDAEYARIALQRSVGKLGQLTIEAARKVVADFANLLFDYVKIIDQPLGGGCDRAFLADRGCDRSIGIEQDPAVLPAAVWPAAARFSALRLPAARPRGSRRAVRGARC